MILGQVREVHGLDSLDAVLGLEELRRDEPYACTVYTEPRPVVVPEGLLDDALLVFPLRTGAADHLLEPHSVAVVLSKNDEDREVVDESKVEARVEESLIAA